MTPGTASDEPLFDLRAVPVSDRFDADDDRWLGQIVGFYADLEDQVGPLERRTTAVAGTKGTVSDVILALGTAGTFTAAVQFFRAWLGRDRSRSLQISWSDGEETRTVSVRGDAIDESALELVARAAARRIGGSGWATPSIGPS